MKPVYPVRSSAAMHTDTIQHKPIKGFKYESGFEYFNILLIIQGKILFNNLFNNREKAEVNFINTIREFAEIPVNKEIIDKALKECKFSLYNGSIVLNEPKIKF